MYRELKNSDRETRIPVLAPAGPPAQTYSLITAILS